MKKFLLSSAILLLFLFSSRIALAQTSLSAGDIAIVGYNADGALGSSAADDFSFILLTNISAGTQINFTDLGWCSGVDQTGFQNRTSTNPPNEGSNSDGALTWTSSTALPCGTQVRIVCEFSASLSASTGTVTQLVPTNGTPGTCMPLAIGGDQIFAFQGTLASPTLITGIQMDGGAWDATLAKTGAASFTSGRSTLPAALSSSNTLVISPEVDNATYNCSVTSNSPANLRAAIFNSANWNTNDATPFTLPLACSFSCNSCIAPSVTGQPSASTICSGGNTSFTVSATGTGLTYQWQENTGSGFTNRANGGVYSGATTATLNITGATAGMSGYTYRCVVTGTCGTATSNGASLTVVAAPAITSQPSNSTITAGQNATFSATVSNATGYQWQVDTGPGFTNLSDGGFISGATTSTLTLTGTPAGANSYKFRLIATGSCLPAATSNSAVLTVNAAVSGTTLAAGDIAIIGWDAVTNKVKIAVLKDLNAGTVVKFTDYGWSTDSDAFHTSSTGSIAEGTFTWTLSSAVAKGTLLEFTLGGAATHTLQNLTAGTWLSSSIVASGHSGADPMSVTGDNLFIYQGELTNPTFVFGLNNTISSAGNSPTLNSQGWVADGSYTVGFAIGSNLPDGQGSANALTSGTNAVGFTTRTTNIQYTGPVTATDAAGWLARFANNANWSDAANTTGASITFGTPQPAPAITGQPPVSTICAGANTTFSVTASNATEYQWEVDMGSGYTTVSNGGVYSGATTATLTITGATAGMNGYSYRVIASGSATPNATSNGAGLTVNSAPAITSQPSNSSITGGQNATFSATASNATSYQWYVDTDGAGSLAPSLISNGDVYSGATTATLAITGATTAMNGYEFKLTAIGSCSPAATSNAGVLTVVPANNPPIANNDTFTISANSAATVFDVSANDSSAPDAGETLTVTAVTQGSKGMVTLTSGVVRFTPTTNAFGSDTFTYTISDGNGGTATGTVSVTINAVASLPEHSLTFNGTNQYAEVPARSALDFTTGTLEMWVKPGWDAGTHDAINPCIAAMRSSNNTRWSFHINRDLTQIGLYNGGPYLERSFTFTKGQWYHIAFVMTTTNTEIFINGASIGSVSNGINTSSTGRTLKIGQSELGSGEIFKGEIDEVRIWNVARTASNISSNYTAPVAAGSSGLIGYYKIDSDILAASNSEAYIFKDYSTAAANGKIHNYFIPTLSTATATSIHANKFTAGGEVTSNGGGNVTSRGIVYTIGNADPTINDDRVNMGTGDGVFSAEIAGLTPGTIYKYRAFAINATGTSYGNTQTATTTLASLNATATSTNVTCNSGSDGTATVSVTGGTGLYTYSWAPRGGTAAAASGLSQGTYTVIVTDSQDNTTTATVVISEPAAVSGTTTVTNVACFGSNTGAINLTPTGGTGPYTFNWGGGITTEDRTLLAAGSYSVTITDANACTGTVNVTVGQPLAAVSGTTTVTNVACFGSNTGAINLTPTGGTGPYTFNWGGGITTEDRTLLAAGSYSVTITDANGCTGTVNVTVDQPASAISLLSGSKTDVSCFNGTNGTASVTPTGGTPGYTYSWAPSGGTGATATGLSVGTYTVTVTDANGCQATRSFTIDQPASAISLLSGSKTDVSCFNGTNGTASVTPTGGTPGYTYSWAPSGGTGATATGLSVGTYTVTVTDANGCQATRSFTIDQPASAISLVSGSKTDVTCFGGTNGTASVTPTGGTPGYTYSWAPSGGTGATATGLSVGTYTVTVIDANGCQATRSFTIGQPSVLSATTSQTDVTTALGSNGSATINVTGGTPGYTYIWSPSGGTAATATGLAGGNYTVTATDANGCTITRSFLILQPASITGFSAITKTYGDADFDLIDPASNSGGAFTYTSSNTGIASITGNTVSILKSGTVTITATQADSEQYSQNTATTTLTIDKKALTITASNRTKVYGDAVIFTGTEFTPTGLINGNTVTSVTLTSTGAAATATVASSPYAILASAATGTGLDNYAISYTDGALTVTKKALTIAASNRTKVYGDAVIFAGTEFTPTGLINGNTVTSVTLTSTGAAATAPVASSPYAILASAATGTGLDNYAISYTDGALTVTKKALTIAASNRTKVYGDAVIFTGTEFTPTGLINGNTVTSVTLTSTGAAATAPVASSPYAILASAATGTGLDNYAISYTDGALTVTKKALTIAASNRTKVYGDAVIFAGTEFTPTGLINGNTVTSVTLTSTGAAATAMVASSPYAILASAATGTGLDNYTISYTDGALTVTGKDLMITANNRTKIYGEAVTFAGTEFTPNGLVNSDAVISVTLSSTGAAATATVAGSTYPILISGAQGTGLDNYNISYTNGSLTVDKKVLTILADDIDKVYGDVYPFVWVEFTTEGLVNGDKVNNAIVSSDGATATATVAGSPYATIPANATGVGLDNYAITYKNGLLTIGKRPLTLSANSRSKVYGEAVSFAETDFTATGLANGEVVTDVDMSSTGSATTASVGTYPIDISNATGVNLSNYNLSYANGSLTVGKKDLIAKADNKEKFAGTANPVLTVSYTGFVNSESSAVLTSQPVLATAATLNSAPGSYDITISGGAAVNYNLVYQKGVLIVKASAPTDITLAAIALYENRPAGTSAGTLSSVSADGSATFTYSLIAGMGSTDNSLFAIDGNTVKTMGSLNFENKANYSIRVKSTTQYGFSLEKSLSITLNDVNEAPELAVVDNQALCFTTETQTIPLGGITGGAETAQTTTLSVSTSNDNLFESISVAKNGNNAGTLSYKLKAGAAGSATVMVVVKDNGGTANGGEDSFARTFTIMVNPLPVVTISSDLGPVLTKGQTAELTVTGGTSYIWTSAEGVVSGDNTAVLTVHPSQTTTYTVTATNVSGCSQISSITITVTEDPDLELVKATNIMSPNGDGKNDSWVVENLDLYPNNTVKIFDRAGRVIFEKKAYDNSWDATLNGAPLAEGTYYYVIEFGLDTRKIKKGFITIIRED